MVSDTRSSQKKFQHGWGEACEAEPLGKALLVIDGGSAMRSYFFRDVTTYKLLMHIRELLRKKRTQRWEWAGEGMC